MDNGYCSRCGARFPHVFTQRYPLPDGGVWCGNCDPGNPTQPIDKSVELDCGNIYNAPGSYLCLTEEERIAKAWRGLACVMDGPHAGAWVPATHERIEMPIIEEVDYSILGDEYQPKPKLMQPRAIYRRVHRIDRRLYFYIEDK